MRQEIRLVPQQIQKMMMSQQMRQSLEILQLPAIELKQMIEEQLATNPLLEVKAEGPDGEEPGFQGETEHVFQEEWNDSHPEHRIADVRAFIQKSVSKLENNGDLHDAGGQGRHHKLSDDDARTCADIISAGYLQEQKLTDHGVSLVWYEHKQYTSLSEALTESDALRALTTGKGLSEDYVKGRLHDVAPYLIYGPLPMKMPLTHAQMAARVRYCKRMLKRLAQDPDFLMKVFWVDECRCRREHRCQFELGSRTKCYRLQALQRHGHRFRSVYVQARNRAVPDDRQQLAAGLSSEVLLRLAG